MIRHRHGGLLMAAVLVFAACGTAQTSPTPPSAASATIESSGSLQPGGSPSSAPSQAAVALRVMGFEVVPAERGTPLDEAYKKFLADFQDQNPAITVESLETPPDADTQLLVDLAAGTGPDVWQQDASSLGKYVDAGVILDMNKCVETLPDMNLDRFFPNVLAINQRDDGAIYGLPNDFTPMMIFLSNQAFKRAGVDKPQAGWTWQDLLETAQKTTLDGEGRNRLDPAFDETNVVQWGYRVRKFPFEWIYRLWENGSDVLSPDGTTATGYLDSPKSIEAIQFHADLVLVHKVAPPPAVLDQLDQSLGFLDRFLKGEFAMFDRGHWEIFGLTTNPEYKAGTADFDVVAQPVGPVNDDTVIYQATWAVNARVADDPAKLQAACTFADAATSPQYQDTKVITGIAISSTPEAAAAALGQSATPEVEQAFQDAVANGRPPWGARVAIYPAIETILESMVERILNGSPVEEEAQKAAQEIDRELGP
jgi:multiple sugar transport system substrate-binding protein